MAGWCNSASHSIAVYVYLLTVNKFGCFVCPFPRVPVSILQSAATSTRCTNCLSYILLTWNSQARRRKMITRWLKPWAGMSVSPPSCQKHLERIFLLLQAITLIDQILHILWWLSTVDTVTYLQTDWRRIPVCAQVPVSRGPLLEVRNRMQISVQHFKHTVHQPVMKERLIILYQESWRGSATGNLISCLCSWQLKTGQS